MRKRFIYSYTRFERTAARKEVTADYLHWLHEYYDPMLPIEFCRYVLDGSIPADGINGPHGFVYPGPGKWESTWPVHNLESLRKQEDTHA